VLAVRIVYTVWLCPYDLVEDEAHYWLWSRHPDWSYYSKGPGIAWAIWLSTHLFGHAEWAIRLPTVLANALGALGCAGLARDLARRAFVGDGSVATPSRAAVSAAALFLLAPAFQAAGMLVTIDGCYLACWALAMWAAWRALAERSRAAWVGLGTALGVGFLFKYTILLLIPGILIFAIARRRELGLGRKCVPWGLAALVLTLLGLCPVVAWNAREGWPTVRHLLGHLGVVGGDIPAAALPKDDPWSPLWTIEYLLSPWGMIGPSLVLGVVAVMRILRRRQSTDAHAGAARRRGAEFLLATAAPILLFYLVVSFIAEPEQNWAIAGFVPAVVLAGWYGADELARRVAGAANPALTGPGTPPTRVSKVLWRLSIIYGLCAVVPLHRTDLAAAAATWAKRVSLGPEAPRIFTGRLIGAKDMAAHLARVLDDLDTKAPAAGGGRAFVMAEHYGRASQMAYYLFRQGRGGVPVLSPQSAMGGRRTQFDLWPETSLDRPDLIGRSAVLLSNDKAVTLAHWARMFSTVTPLATESGSQKLDGEHKKDRVAWIGRGYRGVP
jgi:hypothetical protein